MLVEYISFEFIIYLAYFKQLFSIAVSMYIHQYLFFIHIPLEYRTVSSIRAKAFPFY